VNDRGVKEASFKILVRSQVPTVLVEVGFLTNEKEAKLLANPGYRQLLADGISSGISKFVRGVV
jgi:N-acetylmuramoyl-L-alanine amidase